MELIGLRQELAAQVGYDDCEEFLWDWSYNRAYTPQDLDAYLQEIQQGLVPLYRKMQTSGLYDEVYRQRRGTVDGRLRRGDLSGPVHDEDQMGPCLDGGIVFRRLSGIDAPSGLGAWFSVFGLYPAV